MKLYIDASNIRDGGGITHLVELLRHAKPPAHGFSQVVVWGNDFLLQQLSDRPWLSKEKQSLLNKSLPFRVYWQWRKLPKLLKHTQGVLFVLGGYSLLNYPAMVVMNQNLLPFEMNSVDFPMGTLTLKMKILRHLQAWTFKRAKAVVFLSEYAKQSVETYLKQSLHGCVIPHGLSPQFRVPAVINTHPCRPLRLLYVSRIEEYKYQWNVIKAVAYLVNQGCDIKLQLIGSARPSMLEKLTTLLQSYDPKQAFVEYLGEVDHSDLVTYYQQSDAFIFASRCETFGQVVLEAMAMGLPVLCSNTSAMPEIVKDAGLYFDSRSVPDMVAAIQRFYNAPDMIQRLGILAEQYSQQYGWDICADRSFSFLHDQSPHLCK